MAIKPNPYKLVCPKSGFSKVVAPKSDCLTGEDFLAMNPICKKCGNKMERDNLYENTGIQKDYLHMRNSILSIFDIFKK